MKSFLLQILTVILLLTPISALATDATYEEGTSLPEKIIVYANTEGDIETIAPEIESLVTVYGGYILEEEFRKGEYISITAKIPPKSAKAFSDSMSELADVESVDISYTTDPWFDSYVKVQVNYIESKSISLDNYLDKQISALLFTGKNVLSALLYALPYISLVILYFIIYHMISNRKSKRRRRKRQ